MHKYKHLIPRVHIRSSPPKLKTKSLFVSLSLSQPSPSDHATLFTLRTLTTDRTPMDTMLKFSDTVPDQIRSRLQSVDESNLDIVLKELYQVSVSLSGNLCFRTLKLTSLQLRLVVIEIVSARTLFQALITPAKNVCVVRFADLMYICISVQQS